MSQVWTRRDITLEHVGVLDTQRGRGNLIILQSNNKLSECIGCAHISSDAACTALS